MTARGNEKPTLLSRAPVAAQRRQSTLAALAAFPVLAALTIMGGEKSVAASEDAPTPGSWRKLAVRTFDLPDDADLDATLKDVPRLLRHFRPQGVKVTDLSVESEGPRKLPRVTFKATMHVNVDVGPVRVERDEEVWVRADVTARAGRCAYDPTRLGFEVKLDLSASEEPVSANVQTLVAALCVDRRASGDPATAPVVRHAELTSFMQVGNDYGTRVAGRLATNMLIKQTDPIVAAVQQSLLTATGIPAQAVASVTTVTLSPPTGASGGPSILPRRLGGSPQPLQASPRKASDLLPLPLPRKEL